VALLAGLGTASAQIGSGQPRSGPPPAPPTGPAGAGSFPQSFLIPGTNTSLSLYGKITMSVFDYFGSQHLNDTSPSGGGATPFQISALATEGPGAAGGTSTNQLFRSIHGGLRNTVKGTNFAFETRTPSDLGEIKTVMLVDFAMFASQNNYIGAGTAATSNKPSAGAGNNEGARIQWAYGTLGPWLIGQYNSAWADPLLITPDIGGGQAQVGLLQTVNIRRPQIRYTYLAGNGITVSAALESMATGAEFCQPATTTQTCIGGATTLAPAAIGTAGSDNLDINGAGNGGITNLPSFNTGISWDQPWGHVMGRVGVGRSEYRGVSSPAIFGANNFSNNVTQWHWAIEGGVMLNTWGQDQWRGLVNYSSGLATYMSDMGNGTYDMIINGQTGKVSAIKELAFNTSYIHRFNPNWRSTVEFGIGFFNKPAAAAGWSNCANAGTLACVSGGTTAAQLTSVEKRHLNSAWSITYSPVPGQVDISIEWDHFERWVQASSTNANANIYAMGFNFYW
jgi:hypothetical protein